MEGMFAYSRRLTDEQDHSDQVAEIIRHNKKLLICSLSRTFECHLLWAHYASGFEGLAVEVDYPTRRRTPRWLRIVACTLTYRLTACSTLNVRQKRFFRQKEGRILQPSDCYKLQRPVRRAIAGHRMQPTVLDASQIICEEKTSR